MDIYVNKKYYIEYNFRKDFWDIKFIDLKFKMDLETVRRISTSLKSNGFDYTVPMWINKVGEYNADVVFTIIKESVDLKDRTLYEILSALEFHDALNIIIELFKISMPSKEKEKSKFEDEDEFELDDIQTKDWDFDYMNYLWHTGMQRTDDMWRLTPKQFFKQLELFEASQKQRNKEIVEEV